MPMGKEHERQLFAECLGENFIHYTGVLIEGLRDNMTGEGNAFMNALLHTIQTEPEVLHDFFVHSGLIHSDEFDMHSCDIFNQFLDRKRNARLHYRETENEAG